MLLRQPQLPPVRILWLVLSAGAAVLLAGDSPTSISPSPGRFQLVPAVVDKPETIRALFKLDTCTGDTWLLLMTATNRAGWVRLANEYNGRGERPGPQNA